MTLKVTLKTGKKIDQSMGMIARTLKAMDVNGSEMKETRGAIMIDCCESDSEIAIGVVKSLDIVERVEQRA